MPSSALDALDGLVTMTGERPVLQGGCCASCNTHTFPVQQSCPRCGNATVDRVPLPPDGTVWSMTVQRLKPKPPFRSPEPFEPFAVGYVDLGVIRVEGRLDGRPVGDWAIGDPVTVAVDLLPGEDPGDPDARWTYLFRPRAATSDGSA
jgi:uncharacterized protein